MARWTLATVREKLVKMGAGARIVRRGRYVAFQLAEVAVPRALFAAFLRRIDRSRGPPAVTAWRGRTVAATGAEGRTMREVDQRHTSGPDQ